MATYFLQIILEYPWDRLVEQSDGIGITQVCDNYGRIPGTCTAPIYVCEWAKGKIGRTTIGQSDSCMLENGEIELRQRECCHGKRPWRSEVTTGRLCEGQKLVLERLLLKEHVTAEYCNKSKMRRLGASPEDSIV